MRNNKNPLPRSPNIIIATQNNTYKQYVLYIKPLFIKRNNNIFFTILSKYIPATQNNSYKYNSFYKKYYL